MATVADAKPPLEPGVAPAQAVEESMQGAGTEDATKESLTPSVFRNTEPVREEQVQNAVKFLSHPKVRGSPVIHRRSFLERKGMTKEEIDEAFRRVPDPAPSAQEPAASSDAQIKSTSAAYPVPSKQALPPASAASAGVISPVPIISPPRFHWTHAVYAIGFLAVSSAGTAVLLKNAVIPRLKSWIRKILSEEDTAKKKSSRPSSAEEAAAAAKAAAAAAAEVARVSREMLAFKLEEKNHFGNLANLLDVQLREIKSMNNAIQGLANMSDATPAFHQEDNRDWMTNSRPTHPNGKADYDSRSVRPTSPPMTRQPSGPPRPESYMEIMAMVQRGERRSNARDIDDSPPNPSRSISNSRITPRAKPWEAGQTQNSTGFAHQPSSNEEGWNYSGAENGGSSRTNDGSSGPWWQKKNVRITEFDQEVEWKTGNYSSQFSEQPVRSTWVPPQPPPIAMPGAAEAIWRPKPTVQKELTDGQLMAHSSEVSEELQKATKFSEAEGSVDTTSLGRPTNSLSEIQEEQEHS